eukprot:scaffold851_cov122-Isochrysis_galbana.AAC.5
MNYGEPQQASFDKLAHSASKMPPLKASKLADEKRKAKRRLASPQRLGQTRRRRKRRKSVRRRNKLRLETSAARMRRTRKRALTAMGRCWEPSKPVMGRRPTTRTMTIACPPATCRSAGMAGLGVPPRSSLVALAWARRRRAQSLLRWWFALRLPPRAELRAADEDEERSRVQGGSADLVRDHASRLRIRII